MACAARVVTLFLGWGLVVAVEEAQPAQGCFIMAPQHSTCYSCCVLIWFAQGRGWELGQQGILAAAEFLSSSCPVVRLQLGT